MVYNLAVRSVPVALAFVTALSRLELQPSGLVLSSVPTAFDNRTNRPDPFSCTFSNQPASGYRACPAACCAVHDLHVQILDVLEGVVQLDDPFRAWP